MAKIKLFPFIFCLCLLKTVNALSADEEEQQKWYDYNSMFIRYGYQMTGGGKIETFQDSGNMLVKKTIQDLMKGRGIFFHPSVFWERHYKIVTDLQYMYSSAKPPNETLFEYAKKEVEDNTCLTFKQIKETDQNNCHAQGKTDYICVFGEDGTCAAEYGQNITKPALFSVTANCGKRGVVHEMGHVLGLQNNQARADREKFLSISYKNLGYAQDDLMRLGILADHQTCAGTAPETEKMPYDFASVMQTGIVEWAENYQLIIIPKDPRHLYVMDYAKSFHPHFSHYDLWFLNLLYKCDKKFGKKCASKKCENFGYLAKNCSCICPKGTYGATCSSKGYSTDVYDVPETPACYKEVTSEDDAFTLSGIGLVKAKEEPFTQHCVVVVTSPSCRLPMVTVDTRIAMLGLKPKVKWWFDNDALSCSYFSIFYNVTGSHTRSICWDQFYDVPVFWIFARENRMWLFVRMEDEEMTDVGGNIKMYVHTTGDYRCKLGSNSIFDAANTGRMRSVGGTAQSATAMAIILPAVSICALLVIGFVYWKFIRSPMSQPDEEESAEEGAEPLLEGEEKEEGAEDGAKEDPAPE